MSDREILELILNKISSMEEKMGSIEEKVGSMEQKMESMDLRIERLERQVSENTMILKALEHKADINKAEHDKFEHQIANIEGMLKNINSNVEVISKEVNFLEIISSKNMQDIAYLKVVK